MKPKSGSFSIRKIVVNLAGIFLLPLLIVSLAFLGILAWIHRYQLPYADKFLPTAAPLPVSTPHILSHSPTDRATHVIHDDFSSDTYEWGIFEFNGKAEVYDGELHLQSNSASPFTIAVSDPSLLEPSQEYFLQADFRTDQLTSSGYGLTFGLSYRDDTSYLCTIYPTMNSLYLYKRTASSWQTLTSAANVPLQKYPLKNTLGVYYNAGSIELDLNGVSTLIYRDDSPYTSAGFGFYVNESGYQLLVDNLFLYRLK